MRVSIPKAGLSAQSERLKAEADAFENIAWHGAVTINWRRHPRVPVMRNSGIE